MSVTIINGGTQGLGEAVARKLHKSGSAGILITGRSADRGEALAAELTAAGTPTHFLEADISKPDSPRLIVEECERVFGVVNGVVNNAASTSRATLFTDSQEHFDRLMATNVRGPYFLIQAAARLMIDKGVTGSIVNIGSTIGHGGQTNLTTYAMTKGALTNMTRNVAYGLMRHGIRVNQVNPGWMDTESEHRVQTEHDGQPENWLEIAEPTRAFGRLVKPWEVANAIAFCLSDDSGLMTGNWIDIDQSVQGAGVAPMPGGSDTVSP